MWRLPLADKLRVHTLAKELGVPSKAILDKCRAEGLDLKNHMSALSAGLAATIREWFSEGAHKTTVESTQRVDVQKVRKARKRPTAMKRLPRPPPPSQLPWSRRPRKHPPRRCLRKDRCRRWRR
jgi:hypothetical protein